MTRLGRQVGRAALAAFGVLAVAACSSDTISCSPCGGRDIVDPNGVISPHDQVTSVRACIDSVCQMVQYQFTSSPVLYPTIPGDFPRHSDRFESIEITTFDAHHKVVRVATSTSIDLPKVKKAHYDTCACSYVKIAYDTTGERFVISTR